MTEYSVITSSVVMQALGSDPLVPLQTGVAGAILSDGTFVVAAGLEANASPWIYYIRVWHLDTDLSVLGVLDIPVGTNGFPTPSSVALADNKVLVTSIGDYGVGNWYSWLVDCSTATPSVVQENPYTPTVNTGMNWSKCGQRHVYDQANDKVIWAGRGYGGSQFLMLEVFKASTGEPLCRALSTVVSGFLGFIGLHMDPTDATQFTATAAGVGAGGAPARLVFTVALDGTSGSYDGITDVFGPGSSWDMAVGDPYVPGQDGVFGELWTDRGTMQCVDPLTGDVLASFDEGADTTVGINTQGQLTSLVGGRHLVSYNEQYDNTQPQGLNFRGSLMCVDQLAIPPTIDLLDLNYFGQPPGVHVDSVGGGSSKIAEISADEDSGVILVVAGVDASGSPDTYSVLAWTIQGPFIPPPSAIPLARPHVHLPVVLPNGDSLSYCDVLVNDPDTSLPSTAALYRSGDPYAEPVANPITFEPGTIDLWVDDPARVNLVISGPDGYRATLRGIDLMPSPENIALTAVPNEAFDTQSLVGRVLLSDGVTSYWSYLPQITAHQHDGSMTGSTRLDLGTGTADAAVGQTWVGSNAGYSTGGQYSSALGAETDPLGEYATLLGQGALAYQNGILNGDRSVAVGRAVYAAQDAVSVGAASVWGSDAVTSVTLPFNSDGLYADVQTDVDHLWLRNGNVNVNRTDLGTADYAWPSLAGITYPIVLTGDVNVPGTLSTTGNAQLAGAASLLAFFEHAGIAKGTVPTGSTGALASLLSALTAYGLLTEV